MNNAAWTEAIATSADPSRVQRYVRMLAETAVGGVLERLPPTQIQSVVALFSGSQALSDWLLTNLGALAVLQIEALQYPRRMEGLRREVLGFLEPALANREYGPALTRVRQFKQWEMLRIAARDLLRLADAVEITREISDVADVCLDAVWHTCQTQFSERFGTPYHPDPTGRWHETSASVIGLGKLGGQELNYSSDVDLLFIYAEEGTAFRSSPNQEARLSRVMSSHQYFNRLAESFVAELTRMTEFGALFRVDLRLRPEGEIGPLCRSLESCENYYAQWGQTWERMMLIKARGVAGDRTLGHEFLEMIQSFRYPRSIHETVLREIAAMKGRIESEVVKSGELERNVKLGRGGIREIEFVAQSLQLLHAGRQPFLQTAQTLPCLQKLAQYRLLAEEEARDLRAAYCFLRDVEHRLQMESNLQTHTIPQDQEALARLARLMGFLKTAEFEAALSGHAKRVRHTYDLLFKQETPSTTAQLPIEFEPAADQWKQILAAHRFRDPETAFRVLKEFAEGPGYVHVSKHTTELARQLIPKFLCLCPQPSTSATQPSPPTLSRPVLSDPDRVLTRLDSFIAAYGARAALFELWNRRPAMFELLLLLFDRSEFLAEVAIRTPDLIDDLIVSERLSQRKTVTAILADLRHGLKDPDQFTWLRRYHEAELMRLGLRDILGLVDLEHNLEELSALAEACLQYALDVVMRNHRRKTAPFVIVGLGKLGGREIVYGSDLDLVFVTRATATSLPKLQKLATAVLDLVSRRTEKGMLFQTDTRLRPDGEKGLLVNSLEAYEEYYQQRAQLWEIQALSRARPVAGDFKTGEKFQQLAARLTNLSPQCFQAPESKSAKKSKFTVRLPAGVSAAWKRQIHEMRMRVERERTPAGQDELAIKTGRGGLMDAEFVAQALCLEQGWQEPHTLRALERGRCAGVLPQADSMIANYQQLRRLESILRRWSYEGETVLPDDPAPYYRVSVRCGFGSSEEFRAALAGWRHAIRAAYDEYFLPPESGR